MIPMSRERRWSGPQPMDGAGHLISIRVRRRTSERLATTLVVALVAALFGTVFAFARDPAGATLIAVLAMALGLGLGCSVGERSPTGLVIGGVLAVLLLGAYALHLLGVPCAPEIAGASLALVVVLLVRAVIASGSADDPYNE